MAKKKKFDGSERAAYWVGVGISAERHGDGEKILNHKSAKIRSSCNNGYDADNFKNVSKTRFKNK